MKKQTITGQIYIVTASENCSYCEVRVKKNGVFYSLLTLKPNQQATFQAISNEVEIYGDENAIILPFKGASSMFSPANAGSDNGNISGGFDEETKNNLQAFGEIISVSENYLDLANGLYFRTNDPQFNYEASFRVSGDGHQGPEFSWCSGFYSVCGSDIYSHLHYKTDLGHISDDERELLRRVSEISNDEFEIFLEKLNHSTFTNDLEKLYEGKLSSHLADTSLHSGGSGGGSGSDEVIFITVQSTMGDYLAGPPLPPMDGKTVKYLDCFIDINLLAGALENAGYKFCKE